MLKLMVYCLSVSLLCGCAHTNIFEEFDLKRLTLRDGRNVFFKIETGRDNSTKGVTVFGEPYTLVAFIPIGTQDKDKVMSLIGLSMKGFNGSLVKLDDKFKKLPETDSEGGLRLKVPIGNLEYQSYQLTGQFTIKDSSGISTYPIDFSFQTEFRRERVNRIFEGLQSI